jgi:hypothetical protein
VCVCVCVCEYTSVYVCIVIGTLSSASRAVVSCSAHVFTDSVIVVAIRFWCRPSLYTATA